MSSLGVPILVFAVLSSPAFAQVRDSAGDLLNLTVHGAEAVRSSSEATGEHGRGPHSHLHGHGHCHGLPTDLTAEENRLADSATIATVHSLSCASLRSPTPSAELLTQLGLRATDEPRFRLYWSPYCGASTAAQVFSETGVTDERHRLADELQQRFSSRDECGSVATGSGDAEGETASSRIEAGVRLLSGRERRSHMAHAESLLAGAAQACCGDNARCSSLMQRVEFSFCTPARSSDEPDPCIGWMYFERTQAQVDRDWDYFGIHSRPASGEPYPFGDSGSIGRVILPPVLPEDGRNYDQFLTHELGHACSYVRRALTVEAGSVEAFDEMHSSNNRMHGINEAEGCVLGNSDHNRARHTYHGLFDSVLGARGLDGAAFECVADNARSADQRRLPPMGPCAGGCMRSHIEEAFAELFSLNFTPAGSRGPGFAVLDLCRGRRDSIHPMNSDLVSCMAQTSRGRALLDEAFGCVR